MDHDETSFRELKLRSAAATAVGFGLALSGIGGAMLWLVLSFPTGAATDIAKTTFDVVAAEACLSSLRAVPTTTPGVMATATTTVGPGAATTSTSVPVACVPPTTSSPTSAAPAPVR